MGISKLTKVGYELSDVNVVQAPISFIDHRAECNPYIRFEGIDKDFYPVIVSPMGAVTDEKNYKTWLNEKFIDFFAVNRYNKNIKNIKQRIIAASSSVTLIALLVCLIPFIAKLNGLAEKSGGSISNIKELMDGLRDYFISKDDARYQLLQR